MSLHKASQYLASKGRGEDSMLVHMTPREVKGLQELAMAHGGSLSINPETGLVEAGWLKSILPMVAGAALTATGVGAPLAALMVGGGMFAATGSLKDGLLAGLGAFGGAGLGEGLAAAGEGLAEAGASTAGEAGAATTAETAAQSTQAMDTMAKAGLSFDQQAAIMQGAGANTAEAAAANTQNLSNMAQSGMSFDQQAQVLQAAKNAQAMPQMAQVGSGAGGFGTGQAPTFMQNIQNMGRGLPQIGNVVMEHPGYAAAAASPLLMGSGTQQGATSSGSGTGSNPMGLMTLSPNFQASRPTPPNPPYEAQYTDYRKRGLSAYSGYAGGGVVALADGGVQSPMAPMSNTMYPQSQQDHTQFATSTQYPNSMKAAMASDYDTRTDPESGQELPMGLNMASGGKVLSSSPNMPAGGIYRDTDPDTANKGAFEAAQVRLDKINKAAGLKAVPIDKARMTKLGGSFDSIEEKADGGTVGGVPTGMAVDFAGSPIVGLPQMQAAQTAQPPAQMAGGGIAHYNLGGYSDGGRMLKGPGDGMSDDIPASIGGKQPARLADGEFVVPADVVSHLGNGSTDAGAKKLYGMMDKVRQARTGTKKQGKQIKADKYIPK